MLNNLIESSSHTRELKRRGYFFLFTVAAYTLIFTGGSIASIYAYEAHLDEQETEMSLVFVPLAPVEAVRPASPTRPNPPTPGNTHSAPPTAPIVYESASNPHTTPTVIATSAQPNLPTVREGYTVGPRFNPLGPGSGPSGPGVPGSGGPGNGTSVEVETPPPAAVPTPAPKRIVTSPRILNSQAIELPKPAYPAMAKQIHLSGSVSVQVLIDESGKVISAHAVSGHALLSTPSVQAALRARFSPTMIGDTPVKVSGVIVYNFVLQ